MVIIFSNQTLRRDGRHPFTCAFTGRGTVYQTLRLSGELQVCYQSSDEIRLALPEAVGRKSVKVSPSGRKGDDLLFFKELPIITTILSDISPQTALFRGCLFMFTPFVCAG